MATFSRTEPLGLRKAHSFVLVIVNTIGIGIGIGISAR